MTLPSGAPHLDFARKLMEHCCWEEARVWRLAIAPLTDEQFAREVPFGLGSIQRECARIMQIEANNLWRIRGDASLAILGGGSQLGRAAMYRQWRMIHAGWAQFMGELDEALFFSDCAFAAGERDGALKVWQLIFDVIYRGTTHRAEVMRMVAEVHEPPQFDLSLMQFLSGVFRQ